MCQCLKTVCNRVVSVPMICIQVLWQMKYNLPGVIFIFLCDLLTGKEEDLPTHLKELQTKAKKRPRKSHQRTYHHRLLRKRHSKKVKDHKTKRIRPVWKVHKDARLSSKQTNCLRLANRPLGKCLTALIEHLSPLKNNVAGLLLFKVDIILRVFELVVEKF